MNVGGTVDEIQAEKPVSHDDPMVPIKAAGKGREGIPPVVIRVAVYSSLTVGLVILVLLNGKMQEGFLFLGIYLLILWGKVLRQGSTDSNPFKEKGWTEQSVVVGLGWNVLVWGIILLGFVFRWFPGQRP